MNRHQRQPVPAWAIGVALLVSLGVSTVFSTGGRAEQAAKETQVQAPAPTAILKFQPPPDGTWTADAELTEPQVISDPTLGASQGIAVRDGKIYAYGDVYLAMPRAGILREYDLEMKPTGRSVRLTREGKPLIIHPTGLTWHPKWGTFLGDTVLKKAVIYRLDWERALAEGNLDHSVLDVINDDAAVNGCRPTFVEVHGRPLLATADYGDVRPEIRLYDPERLLETKRSSAPGAIVFRILSGPFNQNLYWDAKEGRLTCVQNVIEGRGWRLDVLDLEKAIADGRATGPGVRKALYTFSPHDELEGYWPLDEKKSLFTTSSRRDNLYLGVIRPIQPRLSSPVAPKDVAR